jgi:predicted nucleic acid-binding protein
MGTAGEMTVSNSGPLIHLAMIGRLEILQALFGRVVIPGTVRREVVDRGKEEGKGDAFLIEGEIEKGWIVVEDPVGSAEDIADSAGIDAGEAEAIMLARSRHCLVLIDDLAARRFATGLGLEVTGSIGVVVRAVKVGLISMDEGLDALEKLARVIWLSVGVYEDVRKVVEGLG